MIYLVGEEVRVARCVHACVIYLVGEEVRVARCVHACYGRVV